MNEEKYFNFPIQLVQGFLNDTSKCLNNILCYSIYKHSLGLMKNKTAVKNFNDAANHYKVKIEDIQCAFEIGEILFNSIPTHTAMSGINKRLFLDFSNNNKSEFEKVSLLAFLALKSIVGAKSYSKIGNNILLARMDGKNKSVLDHNELSSEIKLYANEYQIKKIKKTLIMNYGLMHYSRYTRGFYVSFTLKLEDLILIAEQRRNSFKLKQQKELESEAYQKAMERLNSK